jgi:N-acetylneuraminic acid mutarotase
MHEARSRLGVAVVNCKIYAIGGWSNNGLLGTNEDYDPASDTWISKAPMPTPRRDFGIAVYQNMIYCIGGYTYSYTTPETYTGVNEVYDPAANRWETKAAMPKPMDLLSANVVNDKIYVLSGYFDWGANMTSNVNMAYDPVTDSWVMKTSPPHRITDALTAVDNTIYYLGYRLTNSQESPTEEVVQAYNAESDGWSVKFYPLDRLHGAAGATSGMKAPKRITFLMLPQPTFMTQLRIVGLLVHRCRPLGLTPRLQ